LVLLLLLIPLLGVEAVSTFSDGSVTLPYYDIIITGSTVQSAFDFFASTFFPFSNASTVTPVSLVLRITYFPIGNPSVDASTFQPPVEETVYNYSLTLVGNVIPTGVSIVPGGINITSNSFLNLSDTSFYVNGSLSFSNGATLSISNLTSTAIVQGDLTFTGQSAIYLGVTENPVVVKGCITISSDTVINVTLPSDANLNTSTPIRLPVFVSDLNCISGHTNKLGVTSPNQPDDCINAVPSFELNQLVVLLKLEDICARIPATSTLIQPMDYRGFVAVVTSLIFVLFLFL